MRHIIIGLSLISPIFMIGCGSSSSLMGDFPALAPLVLSATPAGLKTSAITRMQNASPIRFLVADSAVKTSVEATFKGTYGKLSGGNATGFIQAYLEDLDTRFAELVSRSSSSSKVACLDATAQTYSVDMSAIDTSLATTLTLDMDVQCWDQFGGAGDQSGTGSGMLFGKSGDDYSLMLTLNTKDVSNNGFGYAAKVSNKDTADETVDLIFGEASYPQYSRNQVARLKAKKATKEYELLMQGTSPTDASPLSGGTVNTGCGLRLIANEDLIYVAGRYSTVSCTDANSSGSFEVCLNATTFAVGTLSDCNTLKTQFTIGNYSTLSNLDSTDMASKNQTIFDALQIDTDAVKAKASEFGS